MYITINPKHIPEEYKKYKLCYIDEIPKTYWDYTPQAKAYRETEEWKEQDRLRSEKLHRNGIMSSDDPEFGYWANPILRKGSESDEYPNPEYVKGEKELYAYFTPLSLDEQWGDDWNDSPYDCNAGDPYDSVTDEVTEHDGLKFVSKSHDITIVRIPFIVKSYNSRFPSDYGYNSPFCVRDINHGAVSWIYDYNSSNEKHVTVNAGDTPSQFVKKLKMIEKNNPEWTYYDDDDDN